MEQGDIVIARLDPAKGGELGKKRPVVVLTASDFLQAEPSVLFICPLMRSFDPAYREFLIPIHARSGLDRDSYAAITQCRTISRGRILAQEQVFAHCTPMELSTILDHLLLMVNADEILNITRTENREIH